MKTALALLQNSSIRSKEGPEPDQEGWLVSYADLITLLFVFFALMLSISSVSKTKLDLLSHEMNQKSVSSLTMFKQQLDQEISKQNLAASVSTEITEDGLKVQFNERILFGLGEATMSSDGKQVLSEFSKILSGIKEKFSLAVEGHTDSKPIHTATFASNWALSSARSVNVLHFLAQNGVDEKRMMVRAYADTRPLENSTVSKSSSEENQAKNRRVTLLVY